MTNKKKLYWIGGIIIVVLGYLNYFRDENVSKVQETRIETTNAKYKGEGFEIEAAKQIDFIDKKENLFQNAKAKVKEMILSGDNAFLDSAKNLALKSNIFGIAPNGWSFKADEIKYDKLSDLFTSDKPVSAENKNLKIKVSGNNFKTDSKMSYIELKGGVTIENEKLKVSSDSAEYDDKNKLAELKGKIKLENKNLDEKNNQKLSGDFSSLNFDLKTDVLKSDKPFTINYGEATLSAGEFIYNQAKDTLDVSKNVQIEAGNFKIKVEKIEKKSGSNVYDIKGKIEGTDGIYSFSSERGEFDSTTNDLFLIGDVKVISTQKQSLSSEKVVYNTESGIVTVLGQNRNAIYKGPEGELETRKFTYDSKNEILNIQEKFSFKSQDYSGMGMGLSYNLISKEGVLKDTVVTSGTRVFKTSLIDLKSGIIELPGEFAITDIGNKEKLISKTATYDIATKIFKTDEKFTLTTGDSEVVGTGIQYNDSTGLGVTENGIILKNSKENLNITGEKAEYQKGRYLDLLGDIQIEFGDYKTAAEKARYTFSDETIRISEKMKIVSKDNKSQIDITNPEIEVKKGIMIGKDFSGRNAKYSASASKVLYDYKNGDFELKKDGIISDGSAELKGDNLKYLIKNQKMSASGSYNFKYEGITGAGQNISFNNLTGEIKGGKIKFRTDKGEEFQANQIDGNLQKNVVNFIEDARGKTISDGKVTNYKGDLLRIHLLGSGNTLKADRVELLGDSTIFQDGITLYSKNGEVNLTKKIATASQGVRVVMIDEKKVETEVKGNKAIYNISTEVVNLTGDVVITNLDPQKGKTVATAESGVVNRKNETIELRKNVIIDTPEAVVKADSCIYNLKTKKIKATGDVVVDYKVKP